MPRITQNDRKPNTLCVNLPTLEQVINRHPLTVKPDTSVMNAIALMSQARGSNCALVSLELSPNSSIPDRGRASCVLVMEGTQLVGIFTERDVVKLTAVGNDLSKLKIAEVMTREIITLTQADSQDVSVALLLLRQHQIRHLPILDKRGQLLGIVTPEEIRQVLQPGNLLKLRCVADMMATNVIHAPVSASVLSLAKLMAKHQVSCVAILEERELAQSQVTSQSPIPVGIITERDIVQFQVLEIDLAATEARTVMSTPLFCLNPEDSLWVAHQEMQRRHLRRLIVTAKTGELVGIVTQTSFLQMFDPLEMAGVIATLHEQIQERTTELEQNNQQLEEEIAKRQQVEAALQESEARYRMIVETQTEIIIRFSPDTIITFVNEAACHLLGYNREAIVGRHLQDFIHSEEIESVLSRLTALTPDNPGFVVEQQNLFAGGKIRWFQWTNQGIFDTQGQLIEIQAVGWDITERKQAEAKLSQVNQQLEQRIQERTKELSESNEQLKKEIAERKQAEETLSQSEETARRQLAEIEAIYATAPIGLCFLNTDLRFVRINEHLAEINGVSVSEHIGRTVREVLPKLSEELEQLYQQLIQSGPILNRELHGTTSVQPGIERNWLASYYPLKGTDGQILGVNIMVLEITERKLAEKKIREQAALLDISTDAIFVRDWTEPRQTGDRSHQILFWNKGAESLYGWNAAEALGKNANELLYKETCPQLAEAHLTVVECGSWLGELRQVTKSGKEIVVQSRWTLMCDEAGNPKSILSVNTDITQKKQLEAQFFRAQRLESLGTLASGIAHDFNNILTPILAVAQLLPLKLPHLDEQNRQILKIVEDNSKRGAELVNQILSFARGVEGKRVPLQVRHLLKEIERMLKSTFPKSIEICNDIPTANLWTASADPTQIHQVLMNLCINARDAMPNGGTLTISARNFLADKSYVQMNLNARIGPYVAIAISDTGSGIPEEIKERIFEPFFTTKEQGKGTGLGLSNVIGIVKNHQGFVNVHSEVGKGTQFEVYLPAVEETAILEAESSEMPRGNNELVLIVDDEARIRETTKTLLENHNYRILTSSNGVEALCLYAQHQGQIDIVLMDIQMPSIDGLNSIRVLQKINPQVKIIAMSGLTSNRQLLEAVGTEVEAFLPKPYTMKQLLHAINDVLSSDTKSIFES